MNDRIGVGAVLLGMVLGFLGCGGDRTPPDFSGRLVELVAPSPEAMQAGTLAYLRLEPVEGAGPAVVVEVRRTSEVIGRGRRPVAVSVLEPGALVNVWYLPAPEPPPRSADRVVRRIVLVRPVSMPRPAQESTTGSQ